MEPPLEQPAPPAPAPALTSLLERWREGEGAAFHELMATAYLQLKQIAAQRLRQQGRDLTLTPTELLHEAVLRIGDTPPGWQNRAHFFASMSLYIRATLVDHARARVAAKRGGRPLQVSLWQHDEGEQSMAADLLALDQALRQLEALDPRCAEVLHLNCFAGLERAGIVEVLGISMSSVDRDLRFARAWLREALRAGEGPEHGR